MKSIKTKEMNNKRCLIISGGSFSTLSPDELEADYVIACDRGLEYADRYGIKPDVIVGDFDSVSTEILAGIDDRGARILRYPKEKDDTDTLIAIKLALSEGFGDLVIVCALGGRTDHTYANFQAAHYAAREGAFVRICASNEDIFVFCDSEAVIPRRDNASLSVFSLDNRSEAVCIRGTKYELEDAILDNTFPIGVSNEFREEQAAISVRKGSLMVIVHCSPG